MTKKDIGNYGEKVTCVYFIKHGFDLIDRNVARKTGEIDVIVAKNEILHFVEVKTSVCDEFPNNTNLNTVYDPAFNLHSYKIRKVVRTCEWYMANSDWKGESQIDAVLVWLRRRDGVAKVRYVPQIL